MTTTGLRIGVLAPEARGYPDLIRASGGEPVSLAPVGARPEGGVALAREWIADMAQLSCARCNLDALLVGAERTEELAGLALTAIRLDLPTVLAGDHEAPLSVALAALGLVPVAKHAVEVVSELARRGGPRARELTGSFSLANALRAGGALGGGPELLVHLAALAREAEAGGFDQMIRVLAPESPAITRSHSGWFREHGVGGLFAHLGEALHEVTTVEGSLKASLAVPSAPPPAPPQGEGGSRSVFVRGRASGTEAFCVTPGAVTEVVGECRVFDGEADAVRAVGRGDVEAESLVVVRGCGPRGGPGLLRLERLRRAFDSAGLAETVTVLTDGVAPEDARGVWASLFTPEAAVGGIIGLLRSGDTLRLDFESGIIRTGVRADVIEAREPLGGSILTGRGYRARYAACALSALEGAGFG